jgi:hypothetical protein
LELSQTKKIVWYLLVKRDALDTWDFDQRHVERQRTQLITRMVVVKVSLLGGTDVSEPSKVDQPERVRKLVHQRSTQTNSLSIGESQDDLWAENAKTKNRLWPVFCLVGVRV